MATLKVYDPPMCCATGICGPQVDPELVRFSADLNWLKGQGVTVERYNLGQQPQEFVRSPLVSAEIQKDISVLPLILVDDEIKSTRAYPSRAELAAMVGCDTPSPVTLLRVLSD